MEMLYQTSAFIGGLELKNRIILAPMQQYHGTREGFAHEYHVRHYGERARGLGLVIIESTAVSLSGRLFDNDIGIYTDAHIAPLQRVVDAVHRQETPIFIQLSHGGRKSFRMNSGHLLAPSSIAYDGQNWVPKEMSEEDIALIVADFAQAARRSKEAGFDGIGIHAAHGFLVHQFLSPLSNRRTDSYGGSLAGRTHFLQDVLIAIRQVVGRNYPVQIRFSASDYLSGGLTPEGVSEIVKIMTPLGVDAIHVSSGGLLPVMPDKIYAGYQVPAAALIKQTTTIPVIAVGLLYERALIEEILRAQSADFIAIGRPFQNHAQEIRKALFASETQEAAYRL